MLQLELTLDDIKWAIVGSRKLKVKKEVCRFGKEKRAATESYAVNSNPIQQKSPKDIRRWTRSVLSA